MTKEKISSRRFVKSISEKIQHAPSGAAWRASCERRFAVPLMRVRQVRALSIL